jgi:hypothetical protein
VSRKIEIGKRRSAQMEDALASEPIFETVTFELPGAGNPFTTVSKIPVLVGAKLAKVGDDHFSMGEQLDAITYSAEHLLCKEDRRRFVKYLEDEAVTQTELLNLVSTLIEEITKVPFDSSTQSGTGASKTSRKSKEDAPIEE